MVVHVTTPQVCHQTHIYGIFIFSGSSSSLGTLKADQIGAAPVTCQRNVPALPSISSSTRTGITVAPCRPQRAPGAAAPYLANWLGCACAWARVFGVRVQINTQVCTHACLRGTDATSGSITWPNMFCPAQRPMWCLRFRQGVPACSPTNLGERGGFGMCQQAYL